MATGSKSLKEPSGSSLAKCWHMKFRCFTMSKEVTLPHEWWREQAEVFHLFIQCLWMAFLSLHCHCSAKFQGVNAASWEAECQHKDTLIPSCAWTHSDSCGAREASDARRTSGTRIPLHTCQPFRADVSFHTSHVAGMPRGPWGSCLSRKAWHSLATCRQGRRKINQGRLTCSCLCVRSFPATGRLETRHHNVLYKAMHRHRHRHRHWHTSSLKAFLGGDCHSWTTQTTQTFSKFSISSDSVYF